VAKLAEYVAAAKKQGSASGHSSATCFRSVKAFKVTLISRVTKPDNYEIAVERGLA